MAKVSKQKQVVFLFGQPGAGKGTQAEILSDKTGFYHLESSKVIEHCFATEPDDKAYEIEGKTYKVADEKKQRDSGELTSPPFIVNLMLDKIKELADDGKSIIFSGSPRTVYEVDKEMPLFLNLYGAENIHFVLLEISAETTMFRNSHRRICELIRHSILYSEETEKLTLCPLDGSRLVRRGTLDDSETIKRRLEVYAKETHPVIDEMEKFNVHLHRINGEQSVADVHNDVWQAVTQKN